MALAPGTRLGPYEISAQIGVGGMGEVYRAKDMNLGRDVAVKVLPDAFAHDPDRLARFEREAKTLAALNHSNIAIVHGLESANGIRVLVMELVEGPTLADRIAQGPVSLDEALPIARQIAQALDAAHEQGIVHRDLKPANIKMRPDGTVKVLDFGLAKALDPASVVSPDATASPTITSVPVMTGVGVLLGTAAYMSPEQAKGKSADKRSDIWAVGCVLYEMLTGRAAFQGENTTEILAAVVRDEPDWSRLPTATPPTIRMLLRRCLQKDPRRRWQHAADVRIGIEDAQDAPADIAVGRSRRATWKWVSVSALLALIGAAIGWWAASRSTPIERAEVTRVQVNPAPADQVAPRGGRPTRPVIAVSPNGRHLVFAGLRDGQRQLYLRAMDRDEATVMPGTEDGVSPFFSPDGQWVGFWQATGPSTGSSGELKKIPLHGGPVVTICETSLLSGVSWGLGGRIVFANATTIGLWQVPDSGGTPQALTSVDATKGEFRHRLPHVLPGGEAVLFTVQKSARLFDDSQIVVQSLVTGARKMLVEGGADARYASSGHLVYARSGTLMAVPFDLARLEVTGPPIGVLGDVMQDVNAPQAIANSGTAHFTLSETGTLAYLPGGVDPKQEVSHKWVDRTGAMEPFPTLARRDLVRGRLAPDGQRVAFFTQPGVLPQQSANIWIVDLVRGTSSSLTTAGLNALPIWTPDGQRIVFSSSTSGAVNLFWLASDGSSSATRLTTSNRNQFPSSWSSDGTRLAFVETVSSATADIWVLSVANDPVTVHPFLETGADERYPEFSPDGRWIAYVSDESGRNEVYVRPYPGPGPRHTVSTNRGTQPAWTRNGRELVYTEPGTNGFRMMSVDVTTGTTFTAQQPRLLFEGQFLSTTPVRGYDVTPDGKRFLMTQRIERPEPPITQIILVQHWLEELKRLVPTSQGLRP